MNLKAVPIRVAGDTRPAPRDARMPPPRRKSAQPRATMSVYPPRAVGVAIGGYRSVPMTQAIRCWAKLLEAATQEVSAALSPPEWNFLALAIRDRETDIQPEWGDPNNQLGQVVERAATFEVGLESLGKGPREAKEAAKKLSEKLRKLSYLHSWAVITALQWRRGMEDDVKQGEEWWTLAHRQKHLGEKAD